MKLAVPHPSKVIVVLLPVLQVPEKLPDTGQLHPDSHVTSEGVKVQ